MMSLYPDSWTENQAVPATTRIINPFMEIAELRARVTQLEKHIHYPHAQGNNAAMQEAAARVQGLAGYQGAQNQIGQAIPQKTDTRTVLDLTAFAKRLLNPEDLGHAVTFEVRQAARRALGLPEVKEYDL